MMGIEFAGDIPFRDVYVHPVVQAPDGRRMSKSLGTGIDPLDEIDVHGADALRFGAARDVVDPGRPLLARADPAGPRPGEQDVERVAADPAQRRRGAAGAARRRRSRTAGSSRACSARSRRSTRATSTPTTSPTRRSASTRSSGRSSATGTWRSSSRASTTATPTPRRTCCTCSSGCWRSRHPVMPFVTEEIWSYLPDRDGELIVAPFPSADAALRRRRRPRRRSRRRSTTVRDVRRWRDLVGRRRRERCSSARADGAAPPELVGRLARLQLRRATATASRWRTVGRDRDPRLGGDRRRAGAPSGSSRAPRALRAEVERAERKLANEGFVAKAPARRWSRPSARSWSATGCELDGAGVR